jgi:hypothetical protein
MDELFRFVALRAPDKVDPNQVIALENSGSGFQEVLGSIHGLAATPPQPTFVETRSFPALGATAPSMTIRSNRSIVGLTTMNAHPEAVALSRNSEAFAPARTTLEAALTITESYINGSFGGGVISVSSQLALQNSFDEN